MEEVIAKIIEIEQRAREIVQDAEDKRNALTKQLEAESEELSHKIALLAQKKNESLRVYEDDAADRQIEAIKADTERLMKMLEDKFLENNDSWVEGIVKSVTG